MKITKNYLTRNICYINAQRRQVKGLMLHSIGCAQPRAEVLINNYNNPGTGGVAVHGFIDGNTGAVYQTLPWDYRAGHCGSGSRGSANNTHIAIEMCEPGCIKYTGGASFTCSDPATAKAVAKRTYHSAVQLFAMLCKMYGLNPRADGVVISHSEGHSRGIASNHGDPEHLWRGLGLGYTMDQFRADVSAAMKPLELKPSMKVRLTQPIAIRDSVSTRTKKAGYVRYRILPVNVKRKCKRLAGGKAQLKSGNVVVIRDVVTSYDGNVWIEIKNGWLPVVVKGVCRVE